MKKILCVGALMCASFAAHADTIEMKVFGMVCGFCAQGVETKLRKIPATEDVFVSLETQLVAVQTRDGVDISDDDLRDAITAAGYDLKSIARTKRDFAELRTQSLQAKK
jgi:copper chaperone CopZ